ncbi:Neurexophilin [Branchiostoma belcheri]|nr:Neurexophilin [Branchiostoma belcheri]
MRLGCCFSSETDSDSDSVLDWSQDSVFFPEPSLRRNRGILGEEEKVPRPTQAADGGCSAMKISVTTEEPRPGDCCLPHPPTMHRHIQVFISIVIFVITWVFIQLAEVDHSLFGFGGREDHSSIWTYTKYKQWADGQKHFPRPHLTQEDRDYLETNRKEGKNFDTAQEWEPIDPEDVSNPNRTSTAQSVVTETWLAETVEDASSKPVHLLHVTSGEQTKFQVIKEKSSYVMGEILQVAIQARDYRGRPKPYGGDSFRTKVHTPEKKSSTSGRVQDHGNGSYTVEFPLWWSGKVQISIILEHSSEAIAVLRRIREVPVKRIFYAQFEDYEYGMQEDSECFSHPYPANVEKDSWCNFSDDYSGVTWWCRKPASLPCDTFVFFGCDNTKTNSLVESLLAPEEYELFFWPNYNFALEGSTTYINVAKNSPSPISQGYYMHDVWYSSECRAKPNVYLSNFTRCLANKMLYMYGDSTSRQYFTTLKSIFGSNMYEQFSSADERLGPRMAVDKSHNFHMYWRFHSFPIHGSHGVLVRDVKSIVRSLDDLKCGPGCVVLISAVSHFTQETIETYITRLKAIRAAIRRLHERHPGSKVILKSVNTREHKNLSMLLQTSNWFAHELNNILREVFSGEEVGETIRTSYCNVPGCVGHDSLPLFH